MLKPEEKISIAIFGEAGGAILNAEMIAAKYIWEESAEVSHAVI